MMCSFLLRHLLKIHAVLMMRVLPVVVGGGIRVKNTIQGHDGKNRHHRDGDICSTGGHFLREMSICEMWA